MLIPYVSEAAIPPRIYPGGITKEPQNHREVKSSSRALEARIIGHMTTITNAKTKYKVMVWSGKLRPSQGLRHGAFYPTGLCILDQ